ncbi:hypothetical protein STFR1_20320 [Bacillus vallismortis]
MLSKHSKDQREQLEVFALSELVPENHLVRKMEEAMNFRLFMIKLPLFILQKDVQALTPLY